MGYGHQLELIGQIDLIKEAKKKYFIPNFKKTLNTVLHYES